MGYYSIATDSYVKSEYYNLLNYPNKTSIHTPYNFLNETHNSFFSMSIPFSMNFTSIFPETDIPFRFVLLSPDFCLNSILTKSEFDLIKGMQKMHQHNTYEIVFVLEGELFQNIEQTRHKYVQNSCCFLNQNVRHMEEFQTAYRTATLSLSREFLGELLLERSKGIFRVEREWTETEFVIFLRNEFNEHRNLNKNYMDFTPLNNQLGNANQIYILFDQLASLILNPFPGSTMYIKATVSKIFYIMSLKEQYQIMPMAVGTQFEAVLFERITILMEKTNGRISRSQLANELHYSGNYINHIVHKFTGLNIYAYGSSITLNRACELLINTNQKITYIINELGYTDRTHFYKLFKKTYNMTPNKYRKLNKNL